MPGLLASEVLGQPGVFSFLKELHTLQAIRTDKVSDLLLTSGIEMPAPVFNQLTEISIIFEAANKFYLSPKGHQMWWLLQAINGGNLKEILQQLRQLDPTLFPYEIVTEGMTADFIHGLASLPSFRRVLICSPWVYLKPKVLHKFAYAVYKAQERSPGNKVDVIVIARPLKQTDPQYDKRFEVFRSLTRIGVEIVLHEKLHSKLYIRDPGTAGGVSQAIFGSENLTSKRNIELGIRITNDTVIINKLITYFFERYSECTPFKED